MYGQNEELDAAFGAMIIAGVVGLLVVGSGLASSC